MMDWENLRHFVALGQAGSLSAAARLLKVDHATVSRRLQALKGELKTRLVERCRAPPPPRWDSRCWRWLYKCKLAPMGLND